MDLETLSQTEAEKEAAKPATEALETETQETETEVEAKADAEEVGEEQETEVEEKPKKIGGYKKKAEKFRLEAEFWRQKALEAETKSPKTEATQEPKQEDFESPAEYYKALGKWTFQQEKIKADQERVKETEQTQAQKAKETHDQRLAEFKKEQKDFDKVMEDFLEEHDDFELTKELTKLIVESDLGPAALYELAKNPEELERLNSLSPLAAAKEFGKLEAKLTKPKTTATKSKAPPPVKPISGTKAEAKKSIYDSNTDFKEWERLRNEELRKKAQSRA